MPSPRSMLPGRPGVKPYRRSHSARPMCIHRYPRAVAARAARVVAPSEVERVGVAFNFQQQPVEKFS
jgi:hypothetical protein